MLFAIKELGWFSQQCAGQPCAVACGHSGIREDPCLEVDQQLGGVQHCDQIETDYVSSGGVLSFQERPFCL